MEPQQIPAIILGPASPLSRPPRPAARRQLAAGAVPEVVLGPASPLGQPDRRPIPPAPVIVGPYSPLPRREQQASSLAVAPSPRKGRVPSIASPAYYLGRAASTWVQAIATHARPPLAVVPARAPAARRVA